MVSFSSDFGVLMNQVDFPPIFDEFSQNLAFEGSNHGGLSLVLDSERGELVKAPSRLGKKGVEEAKAIAALKSHSEAERRRRERINKHLTVLRSLVPSTDKMDKASLLAEVINHVLELKKNATEASRRCTVPTDFDEVKVEPDVDGLSQGGFSIKASLCCDDHPELLSDLKRTLQGLPLKTVRAEISTLGGRVKNVIVMTHEGHIDDTERRNFTSSVHQALKSVLDRVASPEFSPRSILSNKRRRISPFDSSSSSL
eukprot:TRINITY_DN6437_c0_g1_i1.p1 TRINITY_DN6437_c0_g1~~TRINITY_DN6437_c0_g1_i1.p1  ORF type:complete len:256 (+),score=41.02 TRINITY_DN6437_c0_g1_i1:141-908(+)